MRWWASEPPCNSSRLASVMHLLLSTHTQATVSILPPRLSSAGINCLLQLPTMNFMTHRTAPVTSPMKGRSPPRMSGVTRSALARTTAAALA